MDPKEALVVEIEEYVKSGADVRIVVGTERYQVSKIDRHKVAGVCRITTRGGTDVIFDMAALTTVIAKDQDD